MKFIVNPITVFIILIVLGSCKNKEQKSATTIETTDMEYYMEPYRPQFHFSPEEKWMNDPNGMVYHKGMYHLFYQYHPDDIVWGPMHWGHATSRDLVHWEHKPIALFPDVHGHIFSGSSVVDKNNTSGFGTTENPPLVAIFTYHLMEGEKSGRTDFQTQGIAYSLDNGDTWTKYEGNPVIGNEGIKDFRDPKVMWHEASRKWVMTLVAGDHAKFYGSQDLKQWELIGDFGKDKGAHGGVWECPDLIPMKVEGSEEEKWVLLISINPGAPNGGSGTQYFVGDFDGNTFSTAQKETQWVDWGTDNYAGVTFSNTPRGEHIFIGWMSNWTYAQVTPTEKWRSAMTLPRKLSLKKIGGKYKLFNYPIDAFPIKDIGNLDNEVFLKPDQKLNFEYANLNTSEIVFKTILNDFKIAICNPMGEELVLIFDAENNILKLDRSNSGKVDFHEKFGIPIQEMPVENLPNEAFEVRIILDLSSIELFLNKGQYAMTAQIFPNAPFNTITFENTSSENHSFKRYRVQAIERIWQSQ
ncbi:MAG: glycoside hydrolase family 32 protein [Maribacter sp.]|nr:glycoside hydrolase family 32 protein [Maribacter sp.]